MIKETKNNRQQYVVWNTWAVFVNILGQLEQTYDVDRHFPNPGVTSHPVLVILWLI